MKIKNLLLIPALLITLALAGCNGGTDTTSNSNTRLGNQLAVSNNGLLVTNPTSSDINWGNDSLENIPVGSKGLKAIKVTNITDQPFSNLTLETSVNKPQSITIDNTRTTCSMGIPLAANSSCLYVFAYSPVGSYESGVFTANVFAEQSAIKASVAVDINYSTRISANAGTLAVNVDTSALNCSATSCNGTLYVKNSKGAVVSSVINITGNSGTTFGTKLVNLDATDSYTVDASGINGSIPTYLPDQTVHIVAGQTTTVTVKYPSALGKFGKAVIELPEVMPAYTNPLTVQIMNIKNGNQVVDTGAIKQGDELVVDLPVTDDEHDYTVKLVNGIADPVQGLFYDQKSTLPLSVKESSVAKLSIPMEKSTSLSDITLKISGLQYESKTSSATDTANISFSDAENHYKYVNQYNQSGGFKNYKLKNGLNFSIQTQVNSTNSYKVNPIVNTFMVDDDKQISAAFQAGTNTLGRANIKLDTFVPNYTDGLLLQLINTQNGNQVVKEFSLKQGDSTTLFDVPVSDESHDYVVRTTEMVVDPVNGLLALNKPQSIVIKNEKTDTTLVRNSGSGAALSATFTISGLEKNDTANVTFTNDDKVNSNGYISSYVFVNSKNQTNGARSYYLPSKTTVKILANDLDRYKINPIENYVTEANNNYSAIFDPKIAGQITFVKTYSVGGNAIRSSLVFSVNDKYAYAIAKSGDSNLGTINYYDLGDNQDKFTWAGSNSNTGSLVSKLVVTPDGKDFYAINQDSSIGSPTERSDFSMYRFVLSSDGFSVNLADRSKGIAGSIDMTPNGYYLYSSYMSDMPQGISSSFYSVQRNGSLTYLGQSSYYGADAASNNMLYEPSSTYLKGKPILSDGTISNQVAFTINVKDNVSVLPYEGSSYPIEGLSNLTVSNDGKRLYANSWFNKPETKWECYEERCWQVNVNHYHSNYILAFNINSNGSLSFLQLIRADDDVNGFGVTRDGKYLYAILPNNKIAQYSISQ